MKRAAHYVVFNSIFVAAGIYGQYWAVEWAWNVFLFMFWVTATCGILAVWMSDEDIRKRPGPSVPRWFDRAFDLTISVWLAALGLFWMAGVWVLHIGANDMAEDRRKKLAEAQS